MNISERISAKPESRSVLWVLLLTVCGIGLNLGCNQLASRLGTPLYLDCVGTVLAACLGGYLPGIAVGWLTNMIRGIWDFNNAYYGTLNVFIALAAVYFARRGYLKKWWGLLAAAVTFALIGGGLYTVLDWLLGGYRFSEPDPASLVGRLYADTSLPPFLCQLFGNLVIDLADKAITVLLSAGVLAILPRKLREKFALFAQQTSDLGGLEVPQDKRRFSRRLSLRFKLLVLVAASLLLTAIGALTVSYVLFQRFSIEDHSKLGRGVADLAASAIDADRVSEYIERGYDAPGYQETEDALTVIRDSSPVIQYVYVYRILPDGCHVVFDLDTEEVQGSEPGEIVDFDESFLPLLPDLLAGQPIDPVISDDSYGWLLTVYVPVYDSQGVCQCYAAADIAMTDLRAEGISFLTRGVTLFLGLFILVLALGMTYAEQSVIQPVNVMALAAGEFAYNSEEARSQSVERIRALDIHTGDEIENLYDAFTKTTEDTVRYITDLNHKTDVISKMQNGLILVLADMVESRDQCTGDHVRKTAAYAGIIMDELRKEGKYTDVLTDEFVSDVVNSAPLHDVGKIQVPDALLNKPGKLTDEEFVQMKKHTTAGGQIIDKAIGMVSEDSSGYLDEAKNLAAFHHERWDGRGYPEGLAGEDIPLSARIMAVADVFDALVSRRSYKEPFPIEKALDIIREGSGNHFDPTVAQAFLQAEDRVREVAKMHMDI